MGAVLDGKYRIEAMLGAGGMGAVYAATNLLTKRRVAIKAMLPRFAADQAWVARFRREAQAAGRIHHPSVVDVYDVGQDGDTPFIVMELLRGTPLSTLLDEGPLEPRRAIELMRPALRGIAAAHAEGIVHRDLKPDNIFLCHDAEGAIEGAKVLDFGISKALSDEESENSLTVTGAVMGTPHYMPLEQIRGMRDLDARADVYAIGVIFYQALTGRRPFNAETFPGLAVEVATSSPPSLRSHVPAIDLELDEIVIKAIARERADRFPDIASLMRALDLYAAHGPAAQRTRTPGAPSATTTGPIAPVAADALTVMAGPLTRETPSLLSVQRADPSIDAVAGQGVATPPAKRGRMGIAIALGVVLAIAVTAWLSTSHSTPATIAIEPSRPSTALSPPAPAPTPAPSTTEPARVAPIVEAIDPPMSTTVARPRVHRVISEPHVVSSAPPTESGHAQGVRTHGVAIDDF